MSYTTKTYKSDTELQAGLDEAHAEGLVVVSHTRFPHYDIQSHQSTTSTHVIYSDVATDVIQGGEQLSTMANDVAELKASYTEQHNQLVAAITALALTTSPPITPAPATAVAAAPSSGIADAAKLAAAAAPDTTTQAAS